MAAEENDRDGAGPPRKPRSKEDPREAKARDRARIPGGGNGESPPRPSVPLHLAQARHVSQTRFPTKPDTPRSSEPILIPKLRIQFADFPYLH